MGERALSGDKAVPPAFLQIFTGCHENGVGFHPLGSLDTPAIQAGKILRQEFLDFLGIGSQRPDWSFADLEPAARFVGRRRELGVLDAVVKRWARAPRAGALAWFSGAPGSGKTALMASLAVRWLDRRPSIQVLPFFFRAGERGHGPEDFLTLARDRLGKALDREGVSRPVEAKGLDGWEALAGMLKALAGTSFLFLLDGMDELARISSEALEKFAGMPRDHSLWLCSGRSDGSWDKARGGPEGIPVEFPDRAGKSPELPAMADGDIREMLLRGIDKRDGELLGQDGAALATGTSLRVPNPFVDAVVEFAKGLPLYVAMLVRDIRDEDRFARFDPEELPPSLEEYFAELLKRSSIGDLAHFLTPLFCQLLLEIAPQPATRFATALASRGLLLPDADQVALVAAGLQILGGIFPLERHPSSDGLRYAFPESVRQGLGVLISHATRGQGGLALELAEAVATARSQPGRVAEVGATGERGL